MIDWTGISDRLPTGIGDRLHRNAHPEVPCVAPRELRVVEGACKSVIGNRLKRGGMHWSVDGANAIIALRCAITSNRFDDYWERQAAAS